MRRPRLDELPSLIGHAVAYLFLLTLLVVALAAFARLAVFAWRWAL